MTLYIFLGSFDRHIQSDGFLPSKTINYSLWCVINFNFLIHDIYYLYPLAKHISAKEKYTERRVFYFGLPSFSFYCQPNIMGSLGGQLMKGKRGDKANDSIWNSFGDFSKADVSGNFDVGKLIKPACYLNKSPFVAQPVKGSSVDSSLKGLACTDNSPHCLDIFYCFLFC